MGCPPEAAVLFRKREPVGLGQDLEGGGLGGSGRGRGGGLGAACLPAHPPGELRACCGGCRERGVGGDAAAWNRYSDRGTRRRRTGSGGSSILAARGALVGAGAGREQGLARPTVGSLGHPARPTVGSLAILHAPPHHHPPPPPPCRPMDSIDSLVAAAAADERGVHLLSVTSADAGPPQ